MKTTEILKSFAELDLESSIPAHSQSEHLRESTEPKIRAPRPDPPSPPLDPLEERVRERPFTPVRLLAVEYRGYQGWGIND
jgi:hypothetical protein